MSQDNFGVPVNNINSPKILALNFFANNQFQRQETHFYKLDKTVDFCLAQKLAEKYNKCLGFRLGAVLHWQCLTGDIHELRENGFKNIVYYGLINHEQAIEFLRCPLRFPKSYWQYDIQVGHFLQNFHVDFRGKQGSIHFLDCLLFLEAGIRLQNGTNGQKTRCSC